MTLLVSADPPNNASSEGNGTHRCRRCRCQQEKRSTNHDFRPDSALPSNVCHTVPPSRSHNSDFTKHHHDHLQLCFKTLSMVMHPMLLEHTSHHQARRLPLSMPTASLPSQPTAESTESHQCQPQHRIRPAAQIRPTTASPTAATSAMHWPTSCHTSRRTSTVAPLIPRWEERHTLHNRRSRRTSHRVSTIAPPTRSGRPGRGSPARGRRGVRPHPGATKPCRLGRSAAGREHPAADPKLKLITFYDGRIRSKLYVCLIFLLLPPSLNTGRF